ncbi:dehydrase and lipid transport-domain-containing protein [Podospora didyma]|uniref:Dehydrase and lipid transport-domain-containing protein n=1 Tax=Podospora didyma TaxID=330526 RepID=A0AAE0KKA5_9PEZI|nr:dehydrase and lipid transport-domain-containing protein [Podospora didyma]
MTSFPFAASLRALSAPRTFLRPYHTTTPLLFPNYNPRQKLLSPPPPPRAAAATTSIRHSSSSSWLLSALPNLLPSSAAKTTLRARRMLPYPPSQIYTLIADIDSYSAFLPHCTASQVTAWTTPPTTTSSNTSRLPALADLTVGWGPLTQSYTSQVYCVPGSIVEAVSGAHASTTIPATTLAQFGYPLASSRQKAMGGVFESLVTRWTVQAVPAAASPNLPGGGQAAGAEEGKGDWTEVSLSVQFQFSNPVLGLAMGQVGEDKVDEMVQAFEDRARALYGTGKTRRNHIV